MKRMPAWLPGTLSAAVLLFSALMAFNGCKKGDHHPPAPAAKGSLQDENGNCMPGTIHGTWYNGITTDTNYVEVSVNVTSPGSYRITTDQQNGVIFADSGIFTGTGLKSVHLKATGSFIGPWATHFTTTFDTTACHFLVPVLDSTGISLADNTWQFTAGGRVYRGAATAGLFQIPGGEGGATFEFEGTGMSGSQDTLLDLDAGTSEFYFIPGTYPTSIGNSFYFVTTTDPRRTYTANRNTVPAVININVTSLTSMPNLDVLVIGTFNGTVRDTAQNIVPITNARFKVIAPN